MTERARTVQNNCTARATPRVANGLKPSGLLALLDQFDVDDDGNIVADHDAAVVQSSVPLHAEVLAIDFGGGGRGVAGVAPGILHRSRRTLNVEHNFFGRAADGEVAGHLELAGSDLFDSLGLERNRGVVDDIEEFFTAKVVIAVGHAGIHGVGVNDYFDGGLGDVLVVEHDRAGHFAEGPADG